MKKALLLSLFLCFTILAMACTCMNPPTYCETVQSYPADLLILGYKFEDNYHGMGIKIVQVLDGIENRDTLTVWGDNGMLCRWYCGAFGMGDTLVFALHHCDLLGGNLEKPDHYQVSICGVYWLSYANGQVSGAIDIGVTSLGLNEFQQLNTSCAPTGIEEHRQSIFLYPNPTTGILTIEGIEGKTEVYDLYGRLVLTAEANTLDLSFTPNGIYFVKATGENGRIISRRVVKN
jgi:hypothetical protein